MKEWVITNIPIAGDEFLWGRVNKPRRERENPKQLRSSDSDNARKRGNCTKEGKEEGGEERKRRIIPGRRRLKNELP